MKGCLTSLAQFIFSPCKQNFYKVYIHLFSLSKVKFNSNLKTASDLKMRWNKDTFPFTDPSWELEVEYKGVWYEILVNIFNCIF